MCRDCLYRMDYQNKQEITRNYLKYRRFSGGWTAMAVIGSIITYSTLLALTSRYIYPLADQQSIAVTITMLLGMSFIIGGAGNIAKLRKEQYKKIIDILSGASVVTTQGVSSRNTWESNMHVSPNIPPSAFIPSPQANDAPFQQQIPSSAFIPSSQDHAISQQSRIPSSAFIPALRNDQVVSRNSTMRVVPEKFTKSVQMVPDRICSFCGSPIPTGEETRFCPNCGKAVF